MYRIAVGKNVETAVFLVLIKRIEIFRHQTAQRRTALADEKNTVAVAVVDLHHGSRCRAQDIQGHAAIGLLPGGGTQSVPQTGGGPAHASETIVSYLYTTTFDGMLYGYGMTIAVAEFVFAALISLLSMRLSRRNAD